MQQTKLHFIASAVLLLGLLTASPSLAQTPSWVEPRALSIVDIAGQVPDYVLQDNILNYSGSGGITQFVSSSYTQGCLRLTVRIYPRRVWAGDHWRTKVPLLGQFPMYDHMSSSAPEMWLRLYHGSSEITNAIRWANYLAPDLTLPQAGAAEYTRYSALQRTVFSFPKGPDGILLPANWGGTLTLYGDYAELRATFTIYLTHRPRVFYLGTQQATFQSYIGPGNVGRFQPLMNQLRQHYPDRHPRIMLNIPTGANYIMFTYPPMPFDVYTGDNLFRPIAGTVRLAPDPGMLSQDLVHGGAFPLQVAWQDADQSAGPYLSLLPPVDRLTPPEYVVPSGIAYNPCFEQGNCPKSVLEEIYNSTMPLYIIYLRVETNATGLLPIPLRMADDTWHPSLNRMGYLLPANLATERIFLPLVISFPTGKPHPLGLFDPTSKRMVGYLP